MATAGQNTASVAIPSVSDLVVAAGDRKGSLMLQSLATHENFFEQLDANGGVTYEALAAGDYTLQTFGVGPFEMMRVRVPHGGVLRFEPMVVNAALVSIADRAGTLAKAGFEDGDLIVGIDGAEFTSSQQLQGILMQALAKATLAFDVERGGRRLKIEVVPGEMIDPSKHGGSITPTTR